MQDLENQQKSLIRRPVTAQPVPESEYLPYSQYDSGAVDHSGLSTYLRLLGHYKWRIAGFIVACLIATAYLSSRLTPKYESTATIEIDRQLAGTVVGEQSLQYDSNDIDEFLTTQVDLIKSDSVLRPVAQRFHLDDPRDNLNKRDAGLAADAPVFLRRLKVERPPDEFLLLIRYRSEDPRLAANVANAIAESYIRHSYDIRIEAALGLSSYMEKQLTAVQAKMERSGAALAKFERELNMINPEQKTSILSSRLLELTSEYTKAEAGRVEKQAVFNSMKSGGLAAALVSSQGDALHKLLEQLNQAEQAFATIRTQYGVNHPEYRQAAAQVAQLRSQIEQSDTQVDKQVQVDYQSALNRENMLRQAVAETKVEFDNLNARASQYQTLKQEADSDKATFDELSKKLAEAGINASFQNSAIRIADRARPELRPVFPNMVLNLLLAFVGSVLLSVTFVILSDVVDTTIKDPEIVARTLQIEVIASLPSVNSWHKRVFGSGRNPDQLALGSEEGDEHALSAYDEAIRTLRNAILLADFDRKIRTLMVSSPGPAEGKTTATAHLAIAHAKLGHRTLMIDGDLRRPGLSERFGISRKKAATGQPGLAEVLQRDAASGSLARRAAISWRDSIVTIDSIPNLFLLPSGGQTRRAPDLFGPRLGEILDEASCEYDLIFIDSPPLLGFAESLQMVAVADGVVVVARAGKTERKAVASMLGILSRLQIKVLGLVINDVTKALGKSYYYNYYADAKKYYADEKGD